MVLRRLLLISLLWNAAIPQSARACQTWPINDPVGAGRCIRPSRCDEATSCCSTPCSGPLELLLCRLCPCGVPREPIDPAKPTPVSTDVSRQFTTPPPFVIAQAIDPPPAAVAPYLAAATYRLDLAHNDRQALLAVWLK
jgi:hypothetical protein